MSKFLITKYFELVINQIDIETESIILRLHSSNQNDENVQSESSEINRVRNELIQEINNVLKFNIDNYVKNSDNIEQKLVSKNLVDSEASIHELIAINSFYISLESLDGYILDKNRLGLLVISDILIDKEQVDSLKYVIFIELI